MLAHKAEDEGIVCVEGIKVKKKDKSHCVSSVSFFRLDDRNVNVS